MARRSTFGHGAAQCLLCPCLKYFWIAVVAASEVIKNMVEGMVFRPQLVIHLFAIQVVLDKKHQTLEKRSPRSPISPPSASDTMEGAAEHPVMNVLVSRRQVVRTASSSLPFTSQGCFAFVRCVNHDDNHRTICRQSPHL